jgi:hypothetical protein
MASTKESAILPIAGAGNLNYLNRCQREFIPSTLALASNSSASLPTLAEMEPSQSGQFKAFFILMEHLFYRNAHCSI